MLSQTILKQNVKTSIKAGLAGAGLDAVFYLWQYSLWWHRKIKMKKLIKIFKILFFTLAFIGAILFIRVVGLLSRG